MGRMFTEDEFLNKLCEKNEYVREGKIKITGAYKGLERELEYLCLLCGKTQNPVAASLFAGHGCQDCGKIRSKLSQRKTDRQFQEELQQLRERGNDVFTDDKYITSQTKMWFYCSKGHRWHVTANEISDGSRCPYCYNFKVWAGFNDIATTSPDIFTLLVNPEDGYKYTRGSNKRTDFRCPLCGHIQNRKISSIAHRGFRCECCGNGISYPNKFGRALFDQLLMGQYKAEYYPQWGKPYVYDLYFKLDDSEYVVEWDGIQHYEDRRSFDTSLAERQRIDQIKNELARQNNVHLIRINCSVSNCDYIRTNIEQSELSSLFDLSQVDWKMCDECAQKNLVKLTCDLWMSGTRSFEELSQILHLGDSTVRDYINRGVRLGWSDYDPKQAIVKQCRPVCITTIANGEKYYFKSLQECANGTVDLCDRRVAEETIRKYSKLKMPYKGLLFEFEDTNLTTQN